MNIIWIDQNANSQSSKIYSDELEKIKSAKVKIFNNIEEAITYMKEIRFKETRVIVSGRLYSELVTKFQENINDMNIAPKIIVFTRNRTNFLEFNPEYNSESNKFYSFGGIAIWFKEVKEFLEKDYQTMPPKDSNNDGLNNYSRPANYILSETDIQLTFEYIDSKEKLLLPLLFKCLIDDALISDIDNFTNELYEQYKESSSLKKLFGSIKSVPSVPI